MRNAASVVRLAYDDDHTLEVRIDDLDFHVNGKPGRFKNGRQRDLIVQVATCWPGVASRVKLAHTKTLANIDLTRLAFDAKAALGKAGLNLNVLEAIRGSGYKLAEGWVVAHESSNIRQVADRLLGQLKTAIDNANTHITKEKFEINAVGLLYVVRSQNTRSLAARNYALIEDAGWQLLHLLAEPGHDILLRQDKLISLKKDIEGLMSFALLWRLGDGNNMTAPQWRNDFEVESAALLSKINERVESLLAYH